MDLTVRLKGLTLKNPLIVTAGEHGRDGETIAKVAGFGPGAITTKTIAGMPVPDPRPCYATMRGGFMNCVMGAVIGADQWFSQEMAIAKSGGVPVIANLAGTNPAEAADLARRAEDAGADIIELPTHCPHFAENLEAQFPGLKLPPPEIYDPEPLFQTVKAVRQAVSLPIIVKLSAIYQHATLDWVKAGIDAGMDAVEVADTLGPVMAINIETGQPKMGGPRGFGGISGGALKPLTLRMVFEIAQTYDIPVIGSGGVESWRDAVEYFMAGASMIGACTAGHLRGPAAYRSIIDGLANYLESHHTTLAEIKGLTLRKVEERKLKGWQEITQAMPPTVIAEKCTACKLCQTCCIYEAMKVEKTAVIDPVKCYGCNLCVDICPQRAIESSYYKEA
ncbi:MAG: tRNA-dihydrouridine synthase [bacterium]